MAGSLSLPTIVQKFRLDSTGATAGAAQADRSVTGLTGSMGGLGKQVKALGGAFVAFEGFRFLKSAIGDAEKTNQLAKTTVSLFGNAGEEVIKWSETTASSLGLSKEATLSYVDTLGVMLKGFGTTGVAAKDMSENLIKVAVDVATFKNADPSDVLAAFQKGLTGASRGLKTYGVDVSKGAQAEAALKLGIQGTATSWTAAQKAAVFYQLIIKGTAQATDAFAKRSGDLTVEQKKLSAEFANFKELVGVQLLPVVSGFFHVMSTGFGSIGPEMQGLVAKGIVLAIGLSAVVGIAVGLSKAFVGLRAAIVATTTAEEGFALTTTGLAGAVGILIVAGALLVKTVYDLLAVSTKASLNIKGTTDKFAEGLFSTHASAQQASAAIADLGTSTAEWLKTLGAGREQVIGAMIGQGGALSHLGIGYREVANAIQLSKPELNHWIGDLHLSDVNAATLRNGLGKLKASFDEQAHGLLVNIGSASKYNQTMVQTALHLTRNANGSANYAAAIRLLATEEAKVGQSSGNLTVSLQAQTLAWGTQTAAIIANTNAKRGQQEGLVGILSSSVAAQQATLQVADAHKKYTDLLAAGKGGTREATDALLAWKAAALGATSQVLSSGDAADKFAGDISGLTSAQKALTDAQKKGDQTAIAHAQDAVARSTGKYLDVLKGLAAQTQGPVHDAILQMIADNSNLQHGTAAQATALEKQISKTSGLTSALATQSLIARTAGKDSEAYRIATAEATDKQIAYREALQKVADTTQGPLHDAIVTYIASLDKIPADKKTALAVDKLPDAERKIAGYLIAIGAIPRNKVTTLTVDTAAALHSLGVLKDYVKSIAPNISLVAVARAEGGRSSTGVPHRAAGGVIPPGGWSWVGEHGPELAHGGTAGMSILSRDQSLRAMAEMAKRPAIAPHAPAPPPVQQIREGDRIVKVYPQRAIIDERELLRVVERSERLGTLRNATGVERHP